jgi:hypothetical protein
MRNQTHYRQGDVGIARLAILPKGLKPVDPQGNLIVLAYGEATGHHHAVSVADNPRVEFFESTERPGFFVLRAPMGAIVKHQEHAPLTLPPGDYQIERQVEYDPEGNRRVSD